TLPAAAASKASDARSVRTSYCPSASAAPATIVGSVVGAGIAGSASGAATVLTCVPSSQANDPSASLTSKAVPCVPMTSTAAPADAVPAGSPIASAVSVRSVVGITQNVAAWRNTARVAGCGGAGVKRPAGSTD